MAAAEHQLKVQEAFASIKHQYAQAALSFRQMRAVKAGPRRIQDRSVRRQAGAQAGYQEVRELAAG